MHMTEEQMATLRKLAKKATYNYEHSRKKPGEEELKNLFKKMDALNTAVQICEEASEK